MTIIGEISKKESSQILSNPLKMEVLNSLDPLQLQSTHEVNWHINPSKRFFFILSMPKF